MKSSHKLLRLLIALSAIKVLADTRQDALALDLSARTLFGVKQEERSWMYLAALNIQVLSPNNTNVTQFMEPGSCLKKAAHHSPDEKMIHTPVNRDHAHFEGSESVNNVDGLYQHPTLSQKPPLDVLDPTGAVLEHEQNAAAIAGSGPVGVGPKAPDDASDTAILSVMPEGMNATGVMLGASPKDVASYEAVSAFLRETVRGGADDESVVSGNPPFSSGRDSLVGTASQIGDDSPTSARLMPLNRALSDISSVHTVVRHLGNNGAGAPRIPQAQQPPHPVSPIKPLLPSEMDDEIRRLAQQRFDEEQTAAAAQRVSSPVRSEVVSPAGSATALHAFNAASILDGTSSADGADMSSARLGALLGMGSSDEVVVHVVLGHLSGHRVEQVENASASSADVLAVATKSDDLALRLQEVQYGHAIDASLTTMQLDEVRRVLPTLYDQLTDQKRQVVSEFFESPLGKIALETPDCIHVAVVQLEQPTTPWGIESLIHMVLANLHAPTDVQGYNYTISLADQMREKKLDHSCIEKFEKELADCSSAVTETDLPLLNKVLLYRARVKHFIAETLQQHFVSGDYEQLWQAALAVNRNECYKSTAKVTHTVVKEFFGHVTDVLYAHVLNGALPFMDVLNQLRGCIQNPHTNGYKLNTEMIEQAQQDPMAKTNQLDFVDQYSSILVKHTDAQLDLLVQQMFSSSDSKALRDACFQGKGFREKSRDLADDYIESALKKFALRIALLDKFRTKPDNIDEIRDSLHASAKYFISNFIALISIYDYMLVVQDIGSSELAQLVFEKAQMLYAKDPSKMLAHYMDQIFGNLRRKQQHVDVGQLPAALDAWKGQIAEITTAEALVEYLQNETIPLFLDPVKAVSASSRELLELETPEVIKPALQAVLSHEYIAALSPAQFDAWNKFATFGCFESFLEMPEYLRSAAEKLSSKPGWGYDDLLAACIAEMYVDSKTKIEADMTVEQYLKGIVNVDAELLTAFGMEWVGFEQAINASSLTDEAKTNLSTHFKSALAFKLKQKRSILSHIASIEGATVAQVWKIALERNKKANLRHDAAGFIAAIEYAKVSITQLQKLVQIFAQLGHFKTLAENPAKAYNANDALCEYKKSHSVSTENVEQIKEALSKELKQFIDARKEIVPSNVSSNLKFEGSENVVEAFKDYVASLKLHVAEADKLNDLSALLMLFFNTISGNLISGIAKLDGAEYKECLDEVHRFLSQAATDAVRLVLIRDFADAVAENSDFSADQMEILKAKALIIMRDKCEAPGSYLRMAYKTIAAHTAKLQGVEKSDAIAKWVANLPRTNPKNIYNVFKGKSLKPARFSPQDGDMSETCSPADSTRQSPVYASSGRSSSSDSADSSTTVESKRRVKFVEEVNAGKVRVSPVASIVRASPTPLDAASQQILNNTIAALTVALKEKYYAGSDFNDILVESAARKMQKSFESASGFASLTSVQIHIIAGTKIAVAKILPDADCSGFTLQDWKELAGINDATSAGEQIWWASEVESKNLRARVLAKLGQN